jgi:hypothetical protein
VEPEARITLVAIKAKSQHGGFFVGFVPEELDEPQWQAACAELGIEPEQMLALADWRTSTQNVALAFVPFPQNSFWAAIQEPSLS